MTESVFESDVVRIDKQGKVAWLVLNRPGQINAVNDAVRRDVPRALALLDANPDVGVIVIRGEGPRGFCAGADVKETRNPESSAEVRKRMERTRWIEGPENTIKPVIAAIHGACMGGGMELALACDIRIASPDAKFALPEVDLGLIPGGGGTQRIGRLIGTGRALDLILSADRLTAQAAYDIGLITRLAASSETLLDETFALAQRIAAKPPLALAAAKRAVRRAFDLELQAGLAMELDMFAHLAPTNDRQEAARAFIEKRTAVFHGR